MPAYSSFLIAGVADNAAPLLKGGLQPVPLYFQVVAC